MKPIMLLLLCMIVIIPVSFAVEPTHNSIKIYLNPFYVNSMTQNVNTTYNFSTITPDGMSKITSAIITVDAWISPTRTFNGWVNGVRCNTRDYTVSTTFAAAGRAVITLDCSNAIKMMANNTFNFTVSGGNIGSSTAWIDITYINNPVGSVSVSGTEYQPGDSSTVFLQLIDSYNNAVNNASCYLDIWAPANASLVHPKLLTNAPMLSAIGNEGVYYYDLIAPNDLGVYMVSAKCAYSYNFEWIFQKTDSINYPRNKNILGTWLTNSSPALNSYEDGLYQTCTNTGGGSCTAIYDFNLSSVNVSSANVSTINVYYSGQESTNAVLTIAYFNGTAFVNSSNTLGFVGSGSSTPTLNRDQFLSTTIPVSAILSANNTVTLRLSETGASGTHYLHNNWIALALLDSQGTLQQVKGNSEMHITNHSNSSAAAVWNYDPRTLTQNFSVTTNLTINTTNMTFITNVTNITYVLNTTNTTFITNVSNITYTFNTTNFTFLTNVTNISYIINTTNISTTDIAQNVWNYSVRELTYYNMTDTTNYTIIGQLINTSQAQILSNTTVYFNSVLGNITLVADNVWNYVGRYIHGIIN